MSASDHIQPMIKVFHSSWREIPPHEFGTAESEGIIEGHTNADPDVVHMGTRKSALDAGGGRRFLHEYEIPSHLVYPTVFGDEYKEMAYEDREIAYGADPSETKYGKAIKGVKEGLFESIPGEASFALKAKMAIPYRNRVENPGDISYMVPKSIINSEGVRHVGVLDTLSKLKR